MSNAVLPDFPGLEWKIRRSPRWSTRIQKAASGRELRATFYSAPILDFTLSYEVLRSGAEAELQELVGFFNARQGSFDSFLYRDPLDNSVTAQAFGLGDDATAQYQLVRTLGGHVEPVMNLNGTPTLYADAVEITSGYSIDSLGMVSFDVAPADGVALTWSGDFYYRCRFKSDDLDFENFMNDLWNLKKLEFLGCLGSKL